MGTVLSSTYGLQSRDGNHNPKSDYLIRLNYGPKSESAILIWRAMDFGFQLLIF